MGRRKKKSQRDEDSNANDDQIPERYRELVKNLNDIFKNRSERDIYLTLRECNMNDEFATMRLLAEGKDIESKIVQNLKKLVNCSEETIEEVFQQCNMDANEVVNRLLSQDHILEEKREIVWKLIDIVNGSGQKIYEVLLEFNMDADEAVNNLLSQGSGNKLSSEDGKETSNVQEIHNHLADSSTTSDNLGSEPPLNSDVSDVNGEKVPISLSEAVSSLSISSSLGRGDKGKRIMGLAPEKPFVRKAVSSLSVSPSLQFANVLKMGLVDSSNENVTKALSTVVAPVEQSLQRQSINTLVDSMRQQGPSGELDLQNSTSPLNQSMPSVFSLTEPEVPFTVGPAGSAHSSTYPSPIGSTNGSTYSSAHSSTYPSPIGPRNGSTHSSAHGSAYSSPSGAAFGSSILTDTAADLRHGADEDLESRLAKNLASHFQKNKTSGDNSYRLFGRPDQNQQSPSSIPIQPQQQQIHQSPSSIPIQQQQQIHQSPSFIPNQPQQQQQYWNYQSPSIIHNQPQQLLQQHQHHQFGLLPPQQLQHQNQFNSFPPQQVQHQNQFNSFPPQQNYQLTYIPPLQQQQLQYHRPPSFEHIQQQQQQQQQQNNRRDPSKQTQKEQWPRNNYK